MDSRPSVFHPRVGTVFVFCVSEALAHEMRGYGLPALVPLATVNPVPTRESRRNSKAIATANLLIERFKVDSKKTPEQAEEVCTEQPNAYVETNCTFIKKSSKTKLLHRQVSTTL